MRETKGEESCPETRRYGKMKVAIGGYHGSTRPSIERRENKLRVLSRGLELYLDFNIRT